MKRARLGSVAAAALVAALAAACGGGNTATPGLRGAGDVQSARMGETFAGKNRCSPKGHDRPFVIEWDATDMSSFEARAASDVVFVRYEGCDLRVVDGCADDSVRGAFGSYRAVEWTSGSVEKLDVNDEGELYAKLPLGAAELGGRVQGGEKFHMEYFVSGTRTATRDAVHRADLAKVAACREATHFVYAYNLGAFALGAASSLKVQADGTVWGFGGGASHASQSKADKAGGDLASCSAESAKEVRTCRVPIRLTLRAIDEGQSADARDARAPETADAANLAGRLQAATAREKEAAEHAHAAEAKQSARDGRSCLVELDAHDQLDPRPAGLSTSSGSSLASTRARCLMLAGQCSPGKALFREALEKSGGATLGPNQLDQKTDEAATQYCQGGAMSDRDQYLKAGADLELWAYKERTSATSCMTAYETAKRLVGRVKPKDEDDPVKFVMANVRTNAPMCLARAGDCDKSWAVFKESWRLDPLMNESSRNINDAGLRNAFDAVVRQCARPVQKCSTDADCPSHACVGGACLR